MREPFMKGLKIAIIINIFIVSQEDVSLVATSFGKTSAYSSVQNSSSKGVVGKSRY